MKRSLISSIIFSILIITACSAPRQPEVTVILEVTVTLPSPTETPTPLPTPSPESLLPQEVKEKFELAGIDLTKMENAQYDKDGLHITLESGEVIVLTNTDLQKGIYNGQDNVLQYRDEANQNAIYAFDKESGKWGAMGTSLSIENLDAKRWGDYSLIENPDGYYEMKDVQGNLIPEVKLFRDGTVDLTYNSKTYTVAFEATKINSNGEGVYGYWDLKDGRLVLAPGYTAEQVRAGEIGDGVHGITIVRGEGEIETKLTQTIFELRDLLMKNSAKEFEGLTVTDMNGNIIENFDGPARSWKILNGSSGVHTAGIYYFKADLKKPGIVANDGSSDAKVRPLQVAINEENAAYFPIRIIDPKTKQEMNVLHVPVVAKEPGKIINMSALIGENDWARLAPYLESKDTRGSLFIWLIKGTQPNLHPNIISNPVLLGFQGEINSDAFFNKPGVFTYNPQDNYRSLPVEFEDVFFTFLEPND